MGVLWIEASVLAHFADVEVGYWKEFDGLYLGIFDDSGEVSSSFKFRPLKTRELACSTNSLRKLQ